MNAMTCGPLRAFLAAAALLVAAQGAAAADEHPGKALYQKHCSTCHDHAQETKSVPFETLRGMRYGSIHFALTRGKMKLQGDQMNAAEQGALVDYIVGRQLVDESWIERMRCMKEGSPGVAAATPVVAGFGFTFDNNRHLTAQQAGLSGADVDQLEFAWALAFPRATTMRAQAAVVGDTLYLPVGDEARLFAVDISGARPCFRWVYSNDMPLRTGVGYGVLKDGRAVLAFSDVGTYVHLVDATTGKRLWKTMAGILRISRTRRHAIGSWRRVYVPISHRDQSQMADKHLCCKTPRRVQGADARNGRTVDVSHDAGGEADPRSWRRQMMGVLPARRSETSVLDLKRGLSAGTGEATSAPAWGDDRLVLAIDMRTGELRWKYQATRTTSSLTSCMRRPGTWELSLARAIARPRFRCVDGAGKTGQRTRGAVRGQKSGTLWALDPDANGRLLGAASSARARRSAASRAWRSTVSACSRRYTSSRAEWRRQRPDSGLHAVDAATGECAGATPPSQIAVVTGRRGCRPVAPHRALRRPRDRCRGGGQRRWLAARVRHGDRRRSLELDTARPTKESTALQAMAGRSTMRRSSPRTVICSLTRLWPDGRPAPGRVPGVRETPA
jgi:outer membrane protein assembly factor BamB